MLAAADADEALIMWEQHGKQIDLSFCDVVMTGQMNGMELGSLLLQQKPGLKAILASGYNREASDKDAPKGLKLAQAFQPRTTRQDSEYNSGWQKLKRVPAIYCMRRMADHGLTCTR